MKKIFILVTILCSLHTFAQNKQKKIIYEYKKYEKFDFGDLGIEGSKSGLGDLSINPRYQVKFSNELPKKPNFNKELIDSVENLL